MQVPKQMISFCLFRLPVLVLYFLFFSVQIFFNLDTDPARSPVSAAAGHQFTVLKKSAGSGFAQLSSKKQAQPKLRLNKRFQPSVVPAIRVIEVELPATEVVAVSTVLPEKIVLPAVFLSVHALRGPPVV